MTWDSSTPEQKARYNARARERRAANREQELSRNQARYAANKAVRDAGINAYHEAHPERRRANAYVNNALKRGAITKMSCWVCGNHKAEAHHSSYAVDAWLDVTWLCHRHHAAAHATAGRPPVESAVARHKRVKAESSQPTADGKVEAP